MENPFKRILIASDLSEMDDRLLSFVKLLSNHVKIEKVYLCHIIPNMLVPANVDLEFHKMFTTGYPIDEKVKDVLLSKSNEQFGASDFKVDIEVVEGKAYTKLLEMIKLKEIDLLVVGNKEESEGSGITTRRLARNVKCNVLFVPITTPETINNILVPLDFSEYSIRALKTALQMGKDKASVTALNIISLLLTDHYYGLSMNSKYRKSIIDMAWEAFDELQKIDDLKGNSFHKDVVINDYTNVSTQLKDYLQKKEFDMVVLGAKGHSVFENFLMGSVTESFVNSYSKTPILIIR